MNSGNGPPGQSWSGAHAGALSLPSSAGGAWHGGRPLPFCVQCNVRFGMAEVWACDHTHTCPCVRRAEDRHTLSFAFVCAPPASCGTRPDRELAGCAWDSGFTEPILRRFSGRGGGRAGVPKKCPRGVCIRVHVCSCMCTCVHACARVACTCVCTRVHACTCAFGAGGRQGSAAALAGTPSPSPPRAQAPLQRRPGV